MNKHDRIQLLSEQAIESIYDFPFFNNEERVLYFTLTEKELKLSKQYRTIKVQGYFICLLPYFKAKQQFFKFQFDKNIVEDVKYIFSCKMRYMTPLIEME